MKRKMLRLCAAALTLLIFASWAPGSAAAGEDDPDRTLAPYFQVEGGDSSVDSLPLKATDVTANINGVIADIFVVQTYVNQGDQPINARYVFPAGVNAAIHGMEIQFGEVVVTAQIKKKEQAKAIFETAKSEGKSAALLEQERPNVFTMNVANIMPGDTVVIRLHYSELVTSREGVYQFVFPTVVGPRYAGSPVSGEAADTVAVPYLPSEVPVSGDYNITVNLSTGVPVSDIGCTSHSVEVAKSQPSSAQITLSDPADYAGNRDYILNYRLAGEGVDSGLILSQGELENFFLLTVQPPQRVEEREVPPREYIFILDVSGSMYGFPLDTAKVLMRNLLKGIAGTDRFNLVLFSGTSALLSKESLPATTGNIDKAIALVDSQEGGGGTELLEAMKTALDVPGEEGFSRSVVLMTDGYISAEKEVFDLIRTQNGDANFFSFGIGSGVNRYLVDGVAKAGCGEAFVVTGLEEAPETAKRFQQYIQYPVLTDIQISYDGFDAYDIEPLSFPDLFAQKPLVVYGKWRGEPRGEIVVTGKTARGDYRQAIPVAEVVPSEEHSAITYLWARSAVERLLDYGNNAPDSVAEREATQLGLQYSLMTPYTSFVAVVDVVRNPDKKSTDVDQPLPLPENVSEYAVGYLQASEPGGLLLGLLALCAAGLLVFRRVRRAREAGE